jgi:cellulose synthase/poly-beta-1,6-N-acetylglucosamine synthase-like glycosyltransferase
MDRLLQNAITTRKRKDRQKYDRNAINLFVFFLLNILIISIFQPFIMICLVTSVQFIYIFYKIFITILGVVYKYRYKQIDIKTDQFLSFTLLIPMYKEPYGVFMQMRSALDCIEYPKDKLYIKYIIEEDDNDMAEIAKSISLSKNEQIIITPNCEPKTKPKALNYAMNFVKSDIVSIFDAEDVPSPNYFLTINKIFQTTDYDILQSNLTFYNYQENLLTQFFKLEYDFYFQIFLPGLLKTTRFLPLGGTGNHFKSKTLLRLQFWDAYNVTEDMELSVKSYLNNVKIGYANVTIEEEAPIDIISWIKQRIRWIKGHVYTYITNFQLFSYKDFAVHAFLGLGLISLLMTYLEVFILTVYLVKSTLSFDYIIFADSILNIMKIKLLLIYFSSIIQPVMLMVFGVSKRSLSNILICVIYPVYFVLHSVSALMSIVELLKSPYQWNKTTHGINLMKK